MSRASVALQLAAALSLALLTSACARSAGNGPEAHLGRTNQDSRYGAGYGRNSDGRYGQYGRPGSAQELAATGNDLVYFTSDSSDLTPEAQQTIREQLRWLQRYPGTVTIEGHADERGTREYNIALGARRAQSVKALLTQSGVDPQRIRTTSYGKERPIAVCNDISCWSQNRRAQTVLSGQAMAGRY